MGTQCLENDQNSDFLLAQSITKFLKNKLMKFEKRICNKKKKLLKIL